MVARYLLPPVWPKFKKAVTFQALDLIPKP
jgi:hypothetical protein